MVVIHKRKVTVSILCYRCKDETDKKLDYLIRRVREGKTLFFCSRKCADVHHSETIKGQNNPNYNGKWHGPNPKYILTTEERRAYALQNIEDCKLRGEFDKAMRALQEGHKRYFSTEEGKRKRIEAGVKGILAQDGRETSIEKKMREELIARGIHHIPQYNLGGKFALDFFLPDYGIVIECDGDYWHRLPKVKGRDKSKNAYVKACGLSLYRFWESEINTDVEACVDVVLAEINEKEAV